MERVINVIKEAQYNYSLQDNKEAAQKSRVLEHILNLLKLLGYS